MLGIFSSKGREHLKKCSEAEQAVSREYGITLLQFQESRTSRVDGVMVNEEAQVVGIYETKSRTGDLEYEGQDPVFKFRTKSYDSMLISAEKIDILQQMSKYLQVAAFLICSYSNGMIGVFRVTNASGTIALEGIEKKKVKTFANVNGGTAMRDNYFIPLSNGTFFKI
jgi:hypothetical protein